VWKIFKSCFYKTIFVEIKIKKIKKTLTKKNRELKHEQIFRIRNVLRTWDGRWRSHENDKCDVILKTIIKTKFVIGRYVEMVH